MFPRRNMRRKTSCARSSASARSLIRRWKKLSNIGLNRVDSDRKALCSSSTVLESDGWLPTDVGSGCNLPHTLRPCAPPGNFQPPGFQPPNSLGSAHRSALSRLASPEGQQILLGRFEKLL